MPVRVAVIHHSVGGRTRVLAEAVVRGVQEVPGASAVLVAVEDVDWRMLARADALVFGCPTYMGGVSAPFKAFMDESSARVFGMQAWKDKLAAGFTNSTGHSGDKLATLIQLSVFAAQHGMIWVSLGLLPGWNTSRGSRHDLNRLGSHLGAMAQCNADQGPEHTPPESDRRTAAHLGRRVAEAALRWAGEEVAVEEGSRHPTTRHWVFPPERPPLAAPLKRVSLRELAARPDRFEHHLVVVGRIGEAQLEIATASEPLPFAHANFTDEYALSLPTGDPLLELVPFLTLLSDPDGQDVGRVKHRVHDLVLHPHGLLHWPGRLRAPYEPPRFGPGSRRTGLSLVFCGCDELPPGDERPLGVPAPRATAVKQYGDRPVPFLLVDTASDAAQTVARVGAVQLDLVCEPERIRPPFGGYVVVLAAEPPHVPGDLIHVPAGAELSGEGLQRVLVAWSAAVPAEDPPESWRRWPAAPFPVFEEAAAGTLPVEVGPLRFERVDDELVRVAAPAGAVEVPRYWAARFLFRVALHGYRLGRVETYGGLYWDDRGGRPILGVNGLARVPLDERGVAAVVEQLYRAVAPPGYVERLT